MPLQPVSTTFASVAFFLMLCSGCTPPPSPGRVGIVIPLEVDGLMRRAKVYPSTLQGREVPALIYFHGNGGSIADSESKRRFHESWPEAVIVYAEGRDLNSDGLPADGSLSWELRFPYKEQHGQTADLAYVDAILDHLATNHDIDRARIFASGHSSGGFFALSLMEHRADVFTGFAVLGSYARYKVALTPGANPVLNSSAMPVPLQSTVDQAKNPRPVYYLFGKNDTAFDNDSPDGIPGWHPTQNSRARSTLEQLFVRNRIAFPPGQYWVAPAVANYLPGPDGAPVRYRLYDGTHSWPDVANTWVIDYFKSL